VRQLESLGQQLERGFEFVDAQTSTRPRAIGLGVALAAGVTVGGLIGLFVLLKVLTALF
jgi:hypothetical protein